MDDGLIILQRKLVVPDSLEKLEHEIHMLEHKIYVEAVNLISDLFIVVSKCLLGEDVRYDGSNKLLRQYCASRRGSFAVAAAITPTAIHSGEF